MENNKPFIKSAVITIIVIAFLVFSGHIAEAVKITLNADKTEVTAGDFADNQIKFTIFVNLSNPDENVPLQRIYLNLTGNSSREFSFDLNGSNILGDENGEMTVIRGEGSLTEYYGFGPGIGYDFNDGSNYDFGKTQGYMPPFNMSYVITLNTSNMSEGDYNAQTNVYAEGKKQPHSFSSTSFPFKIHPRSYRDPVPTNPPSSSGGGGGGGGSSGENASNIELIEKYDLQISKDVTTSYRFTHVKNPIMFVNITGNTTLGVITASDEVLKSTSALVKTPPGGLVYKNINIWVGTSGFATPKNIKEASIKFRVDNAWMNINSVTNNDIILVKWNGDSWIELETTVLSKDDTNTFFEGKTNAFSPFAITVKTDGVKSSPGLEIPQKPGVTIRDTNENQQRPAEKPIITRIASSGKISSWSIILIILIINIIIVAMYFKWVKK